MQINMHLFDTHGVVHSQLDIDLSQLLPSYELAWCAIDRLSRKFQRPFVVPFTPQEIALNVKERVGLWSLFHSCRHDLDRLHFLVCTRY